MPDGGRFVTVETVEISVEIEIRPEDEA